MVFRKSLIENVEESCQVKSISAVPEKVDFNFSFYESLEPFFYFLFLKAEIICFSLLEPQRTK